MDLADYLAVGYYVVKRTERPHYVSALVPDPLLTLSHCISEVAPATWVVDHPGYCNTQEQRLAEALKFGITEDALPSFTSWAWKMPCHSYFSSASEAQEFLGRFVTVPDVAVVGIGLHRTLVEFLIDQSGDDVNGGYDMVDRIDQKHELSDGGVPLGFELLGFCGMAFHSWLCHDIPDEIGEKFGLRPNQYGFMDDLDDAVRIVKYMKETGAEMAMWAPMLIVEYPSPAAVVPD